MRRHTASRDTPVAVHGRRNDSIAAQFVRCDVRPPILFSPPGHGLVASPNYSSASKSIRESLSGAELRLTTTVSQERHGPLTNSSGRPDPTLIGFLVESGRHASCQPPRAYIYLFALGPTGLSIERTGPARSHARKLIRSNYALRLAPPGTTRAT